MLQNNRYVQKQGTWREFKRQTTTTTKQGCRPAVSTILWFKKANKCISTQSCYAGKQEMHMYGNTYTENKDLCTLCCQVEKVLGLRANKASEEMPGAKQTLPKCTEIIYII